MPQHDWTSPLTKLPPSGMPLLVVEHGSRDVRIGRFNVANVSELMALLTLAWWAPLPAPPCYPSAWTNDADGLAPCWPW